MIMRLKPEPHLISHHKKFGNAFLKSGLMSNAQPLFLLKLQRSLNS